MAKRYRSRIAETVHKTAEGLHRIGAIDKTTMREFDVMCLTLVEDLSAREIQKIRKNRASARCGPESGGAQSVTVLGFFWSATMNTMIVARLSALGFRETEWTAVGGS